MLLDLRHWFMESPILRPKTPCENCQRPTAVAIAPSGCFVYLGCASCGRVWTIRDRRQDDRSEDASARLQS